MSDLPGTNWTNARNKYNCDLLKDMESRNQSAYGDVDWETVIGIMPKKCVGYIKGVRDGSLSGKLDLSQGMLRFDSMENPEFYLEAYLRPPLAYKGGASVVFDDVQNTFGGGSLDPNHKFLCKFFLNINII